MDHCIFLIKTRVVMTTDMRPPTTYKYYTASASLLMLAALLSELACLKEAAMFHIGSIRSQCNLYMMSHVAEGSMQLTHQCMTACKIANRHVAEPACSLTRLQPL